MMWHLNCICLKTNTAVLIEQIVSPIAVTLIQKLFSVNTWLKFESEIDHIFPASYKFL